MSKDLKLLQSALGTPFLNKKLLRQAFTHSSYVNENRTAGYRDNERLEFLGDAVLELMMSEYLYTTFPNKPEGELTKLRASIVCEPSLVRFAEQLQFGQYVLLGKGEELTGGRNRPALLADVFESFLGALYLDKGIDAVRDFLQRHIFPKLVDGADSPMIDFKTQFQELVQHEGLGTPEYQITGERGPAHDRQFDAQVVLGGNVLGTGSGRTKKEAEQQAAAKAMEKHIQKNET